MGSFKLLSAIKTKVEVPKFERKGRLFVKAKFGRHSVKALVDMGASHNFLEANKAYRLGIKYTQEKGLLKVVNS